VNAVTERFVGEETRIDRSIYLPAGNGKPTLTILRPMPLRIVHYNHPVLRTKGEKLNSFDTALAELANEMIETMHEAGGIGLAAQQVGRSLQLCVVDLRESDADFSWELDGAKPPLDLFMPMVLANPRIKAVPGTPETVFEEGCLSFPKIRGDVERPDAVIAEFQDERGVPHVLKCDGLLSRCIQHEVDHLNGVLFIDRMDKKTRSSIDEEVKALAKETKAAAKK
jgi:peptide deformylase